MRRQELVPNDGRMQINSRKSKIQRLIAAVDNFFNCREDNMIATEVALGATGTKIDPPSRWQRLRIFALSFLSELFFVSSAGCQEVEMHAVRSDLGCELTFTLPNSGEEYTVGLVVRCKGKGKGSHKPAGGKDESGGYDKEGCTIVNGVRIC